MLYSKNENKVMLGCRIAPDLKDELQEEANYLGLTLSNYTEQILDNRPSPYDEDEDSDMEDENDQNSSESSSWTDDEIDDLITERDNFSIQASRLTRRIEILEAQLEDRENEVSELRKYHSPHNPTRFLEYLETLHQIYPDYTPAKLIELCVLTAIDAENAVMFKSTIGTVLQDYPDFFD